MLKFRKSTILMLCLTAVCGISLLASAPLSVSATNPQTLGETAVVKVAVSDGCPAYTIAWQTNTGLSGSVITWSKTATLYVPLTAPSTTVTVTATDTCGGSAVTSLVIAHP